MVGDVEDHAPHTVQPMGVCCSPWRACLKFRSSGFTEDGSAGQSAADGQSKALILKRVALKVADLGGWAVDGKRRGDVSRDFGCPDVVMSRKRSRA